MKKTLLAIGLAVATMPLTFAAQAPSAPAAGSNPAPATTGATTTKKHVKKHHKVKKSQTSASVAPAAKPAPTK